MAVTPQKVQRRLAFWVREGMLRATGGSGDTTTYTVMKTMDEAQAYGDGGDGGDDADEEAAAGADGDGMHVYEQYILGMLSNFDSLPLDRIHNMLKMFVSDDTPCKTPRSAPPRSASAPAPPPFPPLVWHETLTDPTRPALLPRTHRRQDGDGAGSLPGQAGAT